MNKIGNKILVAGIMSISICMTTWAGQGELNGFENLVTDAYSKECRYNFLSDDEEIASFRIPQVNLDSDDAKRVNKEIYDAWYPEIQNAIAEIDSYGWPSTSDGMSYRWNVSGNILSLVASNNYWPEWSGGLEYFVYNFSLPAGTLLSNNEVYSAAGFSQTEYNNRVTQALGSRFFEGLESHIETNGYDDFLREQYENTVSDQNIARSMPYINEEGQLCIIAAIYSLAGGEYYWHDLNLQSFELNSSYESYIKQKA